jgi:hypothetical protein
MTNPLDSKINTITDLHHIAYVSLSRAPLELDFLTKIMEVSKNNNERDDITGVLMYHDLLFFQVLEGGKSVVEDCYARISHDSRHTALSLMLEESAEIRAFSSWAMGYVGPEEIRGHTKEKLQSLEDFRNNKTEKLERDSLALLLAHQVFNNFQSPGRSRHSILTRTAQSGH